ncbi:MAG: hypothetical protein KY453_04455 [Gemmatimonadetes bacterium]|nr:hypothetical protein [Gemmatimonadota bacterium]
MRICLLTDDDLSRPPPPGDWHCDPRPHLPEADWEVATLNKKTAVKRILELSRQGFDVFFNLCDGAWDEGRPGIEVVQTLERLDVPFTGATSAFFEPSREAMKRVCAAWGVDTPGHDVERAAETLRYPLIVKHPSSYASVGLTPDSRVEGAEALRTQAALMMDAYGSALLEEFIEGREFTVLVAEDPADASTPSTYTPIEFRFPEGTTFKHYALKWVDFHAMGDAPVSDPELEARLRDASARLFLGLGGAGFGRCDLRVDAAGRPWMLEINPNCGVYYPEEDPGSADLCLRCDPAGHAGFTRQLVDAALARHARRRRGWEVRSTRGGDYGLFATRAFSPGERVVGFEEESHHLVTRSHVERTWCEPQATWFRTYAWPLTEEIYVIWGPDPESWKPLNHACEPSAWLEGLDVVARLPLEPGDEITMDYATFCNELMPSFECVCGAAACRGTITGRDHLTDAAGRYGVHVSDYVRRKRSDA